MKKTILSGVVFSLGLSAATIYPALANDEKLMVGIIDIYPPSCNNQSQPLFANPYYPEKFFVCSHGRVNLLDCPSGMYFNSSVSACILPNGGSGSNRVEISFDPSKFLANLKTFQSESPNSPGITKGYELFGDEESKPKPNLE
ncbi:MAG: hypothetical protein HC796_09390 [Synechococcaceae cyanobacterium RL_1_2]|nr:hypothetical protein [Synechococcaceae cyanobacterium RL_1_2]